MRDETAGRHSAYEEVWIGLVEVAPAPGRTTLGRSGGAFTNGLAWVASDLDYRRAVGDALAALGLRMVEAEDVEPLMVRLDKYTVEDGLLDLAEDVRTTHRVRLGSFHTFPDQRQ